MVSKKMLILICLGLSIMISTLTIATGCIGKLGPLVNGSGNLATWDMDYRDFTEIDVGYAFDVEINKADAYLVRVTIDEELYEYLDISQSGETLRIRLKPNYGYTNVTQRAVITLPDLRGLDLSGASQADVSGFSASHSMDFDLSGASRMDMSDMKAGDTSLELSGASKASGSIEMADGIFDLSGASTLELEGSAKDIEIDASGASHARLDNFTVIDAEVNLSGASDVNINASGQLDGDLSGASKLNYKGNPRLGSINASGGSKISQK